MTTDVSTASAAHNRIKNDAAMIRALVAGTPAMRKAGETYLPKEPAESVDAYKCRVARSVLFNATGKTVADMTGKVFAKPIQLEADMPAELVVYAENIDLTGRHLNVFARDAFEDALQSGVGYIYVDMPAPVARADGQPATIADEQELRPYLTYIPAERLLGWKSETINGVETLTQIRIMECVSEPDGDYLEKEVEQVRVVTRSALGITWQTFRKSEKEEWVLHESGNIVGPKAIPLAPVYINRNAFMEGKPPLAKLAELNVAHWQSSSDQRNILHVARVPILFGAGFGPDDTLTIGANSMVKSSDANAKLTFVEHTGAAIDAGQVDLDKLELQMQAMGLQLLTPQPGGKTATGEVLDNSKENSPLAMMARALQDALEQAFGFMAEFKGVAWQRKPRGKDSGGSIVVNVDYGVSAGDVATVLDAYKSGLIDRATAIRELQRRNVVSNTEDAETIIARAEAEAPEVDAGTGKGLTL